MQTASHTLFSIQNPSCSLWGVHFDLPVLRPLFHIADGPLFVLSTQPLRETFVGSNNIIATQTTKGSFGYCCYTAIPVCRHHLLINNKLHNSNSPSQFINKDASWGTIIVPLLLCPFVSLSFRTFVPLSPRTIAPSTTRSNAVMVSRKNDSRPLNISPGVSPANLTPLYFL